MHGQHVPRANSTAIHANVIIYIINNEDVMDLGLFLIKF